MDGEVIDNASFLQRHGQEPVSQTRLGKNRWATREMIGTRGLADDRLVQQFRKRELDRQLRCIITLAIRLLSAVATQLEEQSSCERCVAPAHWRWRVSLGK